MRHAKALLLTAVVTTLATASVLNWRAQLETNRKLDTIAAALAARPTESAPGPIPDEPKPLPLVIPASGTVPRELGPVKLPPYVIEAPDVLTIDATRFIPLPPYRLEPLDVLSVTGENTLAGGPINGLYPIDPDGNIDLGPRYRGKVKVRDLDTDAAQEAVQTKVREVASGATVKVSLAQSRGVQQISGQHIVRPDGTVALGSYGSVYVAGLSLAQAKQAIEAHLSKYLFRPEVSIDVYAYNSKFCYVITDATDGQQVLRLPLSGSETVLEAIANIGGLSDTSAKRKIWVARPSTSGNGPHQILRVDWAAITQLGDTTTNYQLLPGDRIHIGNPK